MEWSREKAELLVSSLRQTCRYRGSCRNMSVSIGIARYPAAGTDYDSLYKNADTALYQTKNREKTGILFSGNTPCFCSDGCSRKNNRKDRRITGPSCI